MRPGCHLSVFPFHYHVWSNLVPSNSANVEGVFIGPISPIKISKKNVQVKYCEGSLIDSLKTVRFVSFEPKLRPQIEQASEELLSNFLYSSLTYSNNQDSGHARRWCIYKPSISFFRGFLFATESISFPLPVLLCSVS